MHWFHIYNPQDKRKAKDGEISQEFVMFHLDVGNDDTEAASFSETSGITNLDLFLTYYRFNFTFLFRWGGILGP